MKLIQNIKSKHVLLSVFIAIFLLIVLFFISFRWQIIDTIWTGRMTPPEPDDSISYLSGIRVLADSGSYLYDLKYIWSWNQNDHLTFMPWSTLLADVKIINESFSYTDIYNASFYFGIIVLVFAILYLTRSIQKDKLFLIFPILLLSFFYGAGVYHGFFWVAPSFYCLVGSLILCALIINLFEKSHISYSSIGLIFLISLFVEFIHPIGKFSLAAISLSTLIYLLTMAIFKPFTGVSLRRLLKPLSVVISAGALSIFCLEFLPYWLGINSYTYPSISLLASSGGGSSSLELFNSLYLDHFTFPSYEFFLLAIGFIALIIRKKPMFLSLFTGFFSVSYVASMFSEYGSRLLVFLWPLTFFVYSFGCYYLFSELICLLPRVSVSMTGFFKQKFFNLSNSISGFKADFSSRKFLLVFLIIIMFGGFLYPFLRTTYESNLNSASTFNKRMDDWVVDESALRYLQNFTQPGDLIVYADSIAFHLMTSMGFIDRTVVYANWDWSSKYAFLKNELNGTYLVAVAPGYRQSISIPSLIEATKNLVNSFEGRVALTFKETYGVLSIYKITITENSNPQIILYEPVDPQTIVDDSQASFWRNTANININNDNSRKTSGIDSLKITIGQQNNQQNDFIYHEYSTAQDWSNKTSLVFDWFGNNSGKRVEILIYASNSSNKFYSSFEDSGVGWNTLSIPLVEFTNVVGSPAWSNVKSIYLRFSLDGPYNGTFGVDNVFIDIADVRNQPINVDVVSEQIDVITGILPFFLFISFPIGLLWSLIVFRIRDVFEILSLSFILSISLLFFSQLLLNLLFDLSVSQISLLVVFLILCVCPIFICLLRILWKRWLFNREQRIQCNE